MSVYSYKGRNTAGKLVQGQLGGGSAEVVAGRLQAEGIIPISIQAQQGSDQKKAGQIHLWPVRVKSADLIMFSRQMYSLTRTGVPMMQSIAVLIDNTENTKLVEVLEDVLHRLESGVTLAGALQNHPSVFSTLYISMISVGENTGRLDESFKQVSQYLELDQVTRKRIKSATRYPTMVLGAMAAALWVVNIYVIPTFAQIFASFDAELPLATRILIGVSNFFVNYWWLLLTAVAGGIGSFMRWVKTESGRLTWDRLRLRFPVIGPIVYQATMARFCRSFSMMLSAGIPINQALTIVSMVVDNQYIGERIQKMRAGVERGESLARIAKNSEMFSPLVLQMMAVGEETGQIETLLEEASEYYEREVDYDLKKLSDAIEPILIVGIGVLILVLALGIFLPLWDMSTTVR